jgi:RNA polymerase sigma factor (sigma-70 family)
LSVDWSQVYRTVYPDLVRYLHRKVWDPDRAADLAQECFVRALREKPERPRAWLFVVAANLARDEARTVIRRKQHLVLLANESSTRKAPSDPAAEFVDRERGDRVRRALESLGDRDREVLLLWDAGANYKDIADETGLAVGAVGTTLARARKRLVEAYEASEAGDGENAAHT